jgi:hypothetical protein
MRREWGPRPTYGTHGGAGWSAGTVTGRALVLHFEQMGNTITVRLPEDLAKWLDYTARTTGLPKGRIVREELEKARNSARRPFLRWAGAVAGPGDLSIRKGFSRK